MKLSVVIPSFEDAAGLWYTVAACRADLSEDFAPDEYEIIGVVDGPEDDLTRVLLGMRQQNMCKLINTNHRTPQKNRHEGLLAAQAPKVFFLDSHVIPSRGFFKRMLSSSEETGASILHAGHCFWNRASSAYGYNMNWKSHFWAVTCESKPQRDDAAYRICLAGHGAMLVDRAQYLAMGGYWDALRGWGGEEPQLNLKAWHTGREVWMEPRVYHWHFMPMKRRLEEISLSVPYVRNFLLVAYASGGQKYLDAVYQFFTMMNNGAETVEAAALKKSEPYKETYEGVPEVARAEREMICSGPFSGDLDDLRSFFEANGIIH